MVEKRNWVEESGMQKFKSHKVVAAFKIERVWQDGNVTMLGGVNSEVNAGPDFIKRNAKSLDAQELVGGYYVLYPDGYVSWSPAEAFEDGYTAV